MRIVAAVGLLIVSAVSHAGPVEVWTCKDKYTYGQVLVTATVDEGRETGTIEVAGVTQSTKFQVAGFDRRWDFGLLPTGGFQYTFVIKPNGDASYYDFGDAKEAKPSNLMKCKQTGASKAPG